MSREKSIASAFVAFIFALNVVLTSFGCSPLPIDENTTTSIVTAFATVAVWAYDLWRNHNFTDAALKGQEVVDAEKAVKKANEIVEE